MRVGYVGTDYRGQYFLFPLHTRYTSHISFVQSFSFMVTVLIVYYPVSFVGLQKQTDEHLLSSKLIFIFSFIYLS